MGLNERIQSLPPDMQAEVADFVEYLHQKRARQQEASSADKSLAAVKALKGLGSESPQAIVSDASRHSVVEVLAQAPGHLGFKSAEEVDAYIRSERDAWDN